MPICSRLDTVLVLDSMYTVVSGSVPCLQALFPRASGDGSQGRSRNSTPGQSTHHHGNSIPLSQYTINDRCTESSRLTGSKKAHSNKVYRKADLRDPHIGLCRTSTGVFRKENQAATTPHPLSTVRKQEGGVWIRIIQTKSKANQTVDNSKRNRYHKTSKTTPNRMKSKIGP